MRVMLRYDPKQHEAAWSTKNERSKCVAQIRHDDCNYWLTKIVVIKSKSSARLTVRTMTYEVTKPVWSGLIGVAGWPFVLPVTAGVAIRSISLTNRGYRRERKNLARWHSPKWKKSVQDKLQPSAVFSLSLAGKGQPCAQIVTTSKA